MIENYDPRKLIRGRQVAYKKSLGHDLGKVVLADLRTYCNATKSNFSTDPLEMARMEGRREVFTRIANFLNVNFNDYYTYEENIDD